jgi:ubiquinone/menaquinone biosynthesis C-methylase UbiE
VDPAVLENPNIDEAIVYDGVNLPLSDASVDLVLSEWTFEHVTDASGLASDLSRVVKPGGWICARTPYFYSALTLGSSLIPNTLHSMTLSKIQPGGRTSKDVFPTTYKMNTRRRIRTLFASSSWDDFTYTWSPEPGYHMGSSLLFRAFQAYQFLKAPFGGECLFVFLRRKQD